MRHYRCLTQIPNVEPIAIPVRPERVAQLRSEGINALPQVPEEAVGVVIATDTARHLDDWAVHHQKFCLIEKPIAPDPRPELERLVKATQGRAFTACVLRFHSALTKFKSQVDAQAEPPKQVFIKCHSYLPDWRPGRDYRELYSGRPGQGGALRELIHEIDYAGWIFGWPFSVCGNLGRTGILELEDEDTAVFISESTKTTCSFSLSLSNRSSNRSATAHFPHADVEVDLMAATSEDRDAMYIRQLEAFIRAIKGQDSAPLATAEEGLKALQVCQAVRLSSASGQPVTL
jgi:predicted dehydrogenase